MQVEAKKKFEAKAEVKVEERRDLFVKHFVSTFA
jgi:hypothetical protein